MTKPTRTAVMVLGIALAVAGCGGSETAEEPVGATTTTIESGTDSPPNPTTTTVEEVPTDTTSSGSELTAPGAIIRIGDEAYRYAVLDDGGTCDSNYLGVGFRASLTRVDESGAPVELQDAPGIMEGVTIGLGPDGSGVIGGSRFTAGDDGDESTSIDSVDFDGNRASGTATFAGPGIEGTVKGSYELVCDG